MTDRISVLVVEDEPIILIDIADQLEAEGPDWDYAAFLSRDLEQYLRDSAEFMAEAWPDDGAA